MQTVIIFSTEQVLDPRASNYASNPCRGPWWTGAGPGVGEAAGISDGYFWCEGARAIEEVMLLKRAVRLDCQVPPHARGHR